MNTLAISYPEAVFADFVSSSLPIATEIPLIVKQKGCKLYDEWETGTRVVIPREGLSDGAFEVFETIAKLGYGTVRHHGGVVMKVEVLRPILVELVHRAHGEMGLQMPETVQAELKQYLTYEDISDDEDEDDE